MKLSEFKFDLPEELIALEPSYHRDEARMMVLNRKTQTIEHKLFKDLVNYFDEGDVIVMNDTKVFPAMLEGEKEKTRAKINVLLLRELNKDTRLWDVLVDPARKVRSANKLYFGENDDLVAEVIDNTTSRGRTIRFLFDMPYDHFIKTLYGFGSTPIPDQLRKLRPVKEEDAEWYQTVFAKTEGSIAAPFACLHFSRELLKRLEIKGVDIQYITLHCGLGNFRAIEVEDINKHHPESEEMILSKGVVKAITDAKQNQRNVCAASTSTMKALESASTIAGKLKPYSGWTNRFIYPPYDFSIANRLLTNFQLPGSPMLMMACAFGGYNTVMNAYKVAIAEKYKFFAYGDALLII